MNPCYITAEIGSNHQGSLQLAMEMMTAAKDAGADAAKFQKRNNKTLYTKAFYDAPYNSENAFGPTYGLHREALEFGFEDYSKLIDHARGLEIDFLATAFDPPSVAFLDSFDLPALKICSCDLTNTELLHHAVLTRRHLIVSTGAATLEQMDSAYLFLRGASYNEFAPNCDFTFLHCVATYPNAFPDLNLSMIPAMKERYPDIRIGASLHTNGPAMGLAARVLGAEVVEMHFTTDRSLKGADQAFSLEPQGLAWLVQNIRRFEEGYGDGRKRLLPAELPALQKMGKSCVAARPLPSGTRIGREDVVYRSPGGGIPPSRVGELLEKTLLVGIEAEQMISLIDVGEVEVVTEAV